MLPFDHIRSLKTATSRMSVNTSRRLTLLRCPFMTFYKNTVQTGFADSVLAHRTVIELWHIPCERPYLVSSFTTTAKVEIKIRR